MGNSDSIIPLVRKAYLRCVKQTPGYIRALQNGSASRYEIEATDAVLAVFIAWVHGLGETDRLAPVAWVYSMFEARGYQYSLSVDRLKAKGHLESFKTMGWKHYRQAGDLAMAEVDGHDDAAFDAHGAETARRRYAAEDKAELCMWSWRRITRGYHPSSKTCCSCRLRKTCEDCVDKAVPGLSLSRRRWAVEHQDGGGE